MREMLWLVLAGALAGCTSTRDPASDDSRRHTSYEKTADLIFTPPDWPKALPADLYVPKGDGPWPAVVLIYGGSWSSSDHRWQMSKIARKLARRGYVVLNVSYRGAPEFTYPAAIDDIQQAVLWLRAHAAEHRIDPQLLATYGFSAGGQLAALLGMRAAPPAERVQAVVAASAPVDMEYAAASPAVQKFLGGTREEKPEVYHAASALAQVSSGAPPVFIYQGTSDKTVDPEHSRRFAAALQHAGVRHVLRWVEGRGHAGLLLRDGGAEEEAIDFLDQVLLSGRPE